MKTKYCIDCGKHIKGWAAKRCRHCDSQLKTHTIEERFWGKVDKKSPNECWLWLGFKIHNGYGTISIGGHQGKKILAHRLSWQIANNRPIPKGTQILHRCDNRACVNPSHLWLGTQKDNIQDMVFKQRGFYDHASKGEKHGMAKLTNEQVRYIKQALRHGSKPAELARQYGMSITMICYIRNGRNWKSVN